MTSAYRQRMDAANLAAAHPTVRDAATAILASLKSIEQNLYWSLDPDPDYAGERLTMCRAILDQAHELVDQAHILRLRLEAHPLPPTQENDRSWPR